MDIEDYLRKKKDLEKKKEILEAKGKLKEEKVKFKRFTDKKRPDPPEKPSRSSRHEDTRRAPRGENTQWFFLGLAFMVALVIVGVFAIYYISPKESSSDIEDLEEQIKQLKEGLKEEKEPSEQKDEEELELLNDTNTTEEPSVGPEFNLFIKDDWDEEESLGVFSENGKMNGKIVEFFGDNLYKYRLVVETKEPAPILCKVDEEIYIDSDSDGTVDEEKFKLDLHMLELDKSDVESIQDSVLAEGTITGKYEARCYFCEDRDCDGFYEAGEELKSAKFKVIISPTNINENNTNSS